MARKTDNESDIAYLTKNLGKVNDKLRKIGAAYIAKTDPLMKKQKRLEAAIYALSDKSSEEVTKVNGTVEVASER